MTKPLAVSVCEVDLTATTLEQIDGRWVWCCAAPHGCPSARVPADDDTVRWAEQQERER